MKFRIPRNTKIGLSFLGFSLIAWICLVPYSGLIILVTYLIFQLNSKLAIMFFIIAGGFGIFSFQTDENTGLMNIYWIYERIRWNRENKIIEPAWRNEYDRTYTIGITVAKKRTTDTETRDSD